MPPTHQPPEPTGSAPAARGFFVAFEGGDGSGKTTQVDALGARLRMLGHEVVVTREPGASPLGRRLRQILLHGDDVPARVEALLFAADRADHVVRVIRPALARGTIVLTDRYIDSSIAYQGWGRELGGTHIRDLSLWATDGLLPDLTVVLDVPLEVGRRRRGQDPDRMEASDESFHARVREAFRSLAAAEPDRYLVVDSTRPADAVAEVIGRRVEDLLSGSDSPPRPDRQPFGAAGGWVG